MQLLVTYQGIRHIFLIVLGLLPILSPIAMAEVVAIDTQAMTHLYSGACNGEIRPDRVMIVGGISAQGLKPALAKAQLDKQIEAIRQYISGKKGRLVLLEVLRAAQPVTRTSSSETVATQPFILVQSLEAEFPVNEDIDAVLERLLQLGLDRFGKQVNVEASSYGRNVMVYYRFSDLRSQLDQLHAACKQKLVEQWCQLALNRKDSAGCKATERTDQRFATLNASLQSGPVLRDHGGRSPFYLAYPWQSAQIVEVEMMGDLPLTLSGPMTIHTPVNQP